MQLAKANVNQISPAQASQIKSLVLKRDNLIRKFLATTAKVSPTLHAQAMRDLAIPVPSQIVTLGASSPTSSNSSWTDILKGVVQTAANVKAQTTLDAAQQQNLQTQLAQIQAANQNIIAKTQLATVTQAGSSLWSTITSHPLYPVALIGLIGAWFYTRKYK